MSVAVVCHWWKDESRLNRGYTFEAHHIRILQRLVEENITVPHRFVCVTPFAQEFYFDDKISVVSPLMDTHIPGTVFARLCQHDPGFAQDIAHGMDKILSLDIDLVITGNIDHIVNREEDYVIWRNPNFPKPQRAFYQSSVQLFKPGSRPQLYNDFDTKETPKWVNWRFGGREQAWISECLSWNEAFFSDRDGVYGAGRLGGEGVYGGELPENACIVSFPGARAPWQPEVMESFPWLKDVYFREISECQPLY